MGPTLLQTLWGYVGFAIAVFVPMIGITGICIALGFLDVFAGMIGFFGWGGVLAWLTEQEKRGTRIGRASTKIAKLLGSDYLE